jgi:hypothetical protein
MWMIRGSLRTPDRLPDYLAFVYSSQRFLGQYNDGYAWALGGSATTCEACRVI